LATKSKQRPGVITDIRKKPSPRRRTSDSTKSKVKHGAAVLAVAVVVSQVLDIATVLVDNGCI
jgi:hypothetical protein